MKKIFSLCILILTLCLGSTVFGAKSWSVAEFEYFMKCAGYGDIDLDEYTFTGYFKKGEFVNFLSSTDYKQIFLKGNNTEKNGFSNARFSVVLDKNLEGFNLYSSNGDTFYKLQTQIHSQYPNCHAFVFNTEAKTVNSWEIYSTDWSHIPFNWYKKNNDVSEEEWTSKSFRTHIFEEACIFSDFSIPGTNYIPQGGKITSSSIDAYPDSIFNGSVSYYPTSEIVNLKYTSGFDSSIDYDLFLEQYRLGDTYNNGVGDYPIDTIDLGKIKTSTTEVNVKANQFMDSAHYAYRICLGVNTFKSSGENEIILSTDWLIPNDNTVSMYPDFARSHYCTFLKLVAYRPDYNESLPEDKPSEDLGDSGDFVEDYLPYFISVPAYPQKNECLVYFYIGDYGLSNISFLIEKLDDSGAILSSNILSSSIVTNVNYGMSKLDFCKYFKFEDNSFYKITLVGKNGVKLDTSSVLYFLSSNTGNYKGDKPYFINSPKGYVRNSGDIVVTIYMPSGYDYEDSVYLSVQKYNLSGDYISSTVVGDSKMWLQLDSESGICPIYVSSFCDFDTSGNYYYRINLNEFNKGTLDITDIFYFDIDTGENIDKDNLPINPNNPSLDFDTTDIDSLVNSTTTWVDSIFSFLDIFPSWLKACIMIGITVVVVCRILGR